MRVAIVPDDGVVIIDGTGVQVAMPPMPRVHAIQWDGASGHIEYKDGPSKEIESLDDWQPIVDKAQAEIVRLREATKPTREQEVAATVAAITKHKRVQQARPFEGVAVTDALFDMQQVCRGLPADDPIPTPPPFTGTWRMLDGSRRKFTCGEFVEFVSRVRERNARLWAAAQAHIDEVHRLDKSGVPAAAIRNYDYSEGLS